MGYIQSAVINSSTTVAGEVPERSVGGGGSGASDKFRSIILRSVAPSDPFGATSPAAAVEEYIGYRAGETRFRLQSCF